MRKRNTKMLAAMLSASMVMGLAACGGGQTAKEAATTAANKEAVSTETTASQTEAVSTEPKIFHYTESQAAASATTLIDATDSTSELAKMIGVGLYGVLPIDGKAALSPVLADGKPMDVNGDGKTWNIKINENAKFENGEKITADTYMYTLKMALDPKLVLAKAGSVASNYIDIENATEYYTQGSTGTAVAWEDVGVKKVDDMTIQIITKTPVNETLVMRHFSGSRTAPIYEPLFEECLSEDGTTTTYGTSAETIISTGPFKLTNWVVGSVREFEKNENFIRADLVELDGMVQHIVEDKNTQVQMFEAGDLDYVTLGNDALEKYGDDPRIETYPTRYPYCLEFCTTNTEEPIVANENFRLALYYGLNREELAKISGEQAATGVIGLRSVADTDGTTFRTLADEAGYLPENNGYDPELAIEYFEKALEEEGMSSVDITLLCISGNEAHTFISEYMQESYANLFGTDRFKMTIDAQPSAQASELRKSWKTNPNAYEIVLGNWNLGAGDYDPISALKPYTTTYSARNSAYGYEALETLYAEADSEENKLNQDKRNELAMEMEKYIIEHAVVVPTVYNISYCIVGDDVELALGAWDGDLGWGWAYNDLIQ